jgi:hypothetical protein
MPSIEQIHDLSHLPHEVPSALVFAFYLREYSAQPLCLSRCLYKQALPNLEHAYLSNMYDFTAFERGRYEYKLIFNVSI